MVKKRSVILFLIVLFMLVLIPSAFANHSVTIPYGTVNKEYWTGFAILNKASVTGKFTVSFYDSNGTLIGSNSSSPITIAGKALKVDVAENFIPGPVSGRFSIIIESDLDEEFAVTMFMGNSGTRNTGFSFQTYISQSPSNFCIKCTGSLVGTRWCDNGDGTVTDLTTGLVWLKKADWGGFKAWRQPGDADQNDDAHTRAGLLEPGAAGANLSDGSVKGDWRIPTNSELMVLGNGPEGVSPKNMRAFTGVSTVDYWSSTSSIWPSTGSAFSVNLDPSPPHSGVGKKYDTRAVWPVRGVK